MNGRAPLLIFAIGNASRGDDALGPALAQGLRAGDALHRGAVELLEVYQLQIEDVLALAGRSAVLFADASRVPVAQGVRLARLQAMGQPGTFTHALAPAALLALAPRVIEETIPPCWLLAVEGESFALGEPLSPAARERLPRAEALARRWIGQQARRSARPIDHAGPAMQ
jgi:hydrogenase maturation protease